MVVMLFVRFLMFHCEFSGHFPLVEFVLSIQNLYLITAFSNSPAVITKFTHLKRKDISSGDTVLLLRFITMFDVSISDDDYLVRNLLSNSVFKRFVHRSNTFFILFKDIK